MKYQIDFHDPKVMSGLIKAMVEGTPVAYIVLDKQFRVHYINEHFLKLRKLTAKDVLGVKCYSISNRGVPCQVCAVRQAINTGQSHQVLRRDILPDGTVRVIDDRAIPLYKNDEGDFDYILEIMIDRSKIFALREETEQIVLDTVRTLVNILESKDKYTSDHSSNVSAISANLARFMGMQEPEVYTVALGALLHDIGKVVIPDQIINKAGRLSAEEYEQIQAHPSESYNLLKDLSSFSEIKDIALYHHERWDGGGYPDKLVGSQIPLAASMVALADAYDAMTSDRSYRNGMSHEKALEEIRRNSGGQFAPLLTENFLELAQYYLPDRASLLGGSDGAIPNLGRTTEIPVERNIEAAIDDSPLPPELLNGSLPFTEELIRQIYANTPAYYTLISDNFEILYTSPSLAEAVGLQPGQSLVGGKCFEVNNKNMECFRVRDGQLACPVVRAFQTGLPQTGVTTEQFGGSVRHFDIYAAPLNIPDVNGYQVHCVMEIMIDRTEEVIAQRRLENDIQNLLALLDQLVARSDQSVTENAGQVITQCESFQDYLAMFQKKMENLNQAKD